MIDQVEKKLQELKQQQREEYYRRKAADLTQWGLVSQKKGKKNAAPIVVTDEEYDALIDASNGEGMPTRNGYAKALNIAAVAMLTLGIIVGFVVASFADSLEYVWFIASVLVGAIFSVILFGLSEAVRLLQQLVDMERADRAKKSSEILKEFPDEQPDVTARFAETEFAEAPQHPYNNP